MKRLQVFACALVLVCSMLALGACGDAASSGTSNSTSSNTSASSSTSSSSTNGNTSTSSSSTSANAGGPQEVKITLGEMYFKPAMTTFKVGQAYQFTLVNEGKSEHEFTIAPPRKT